jgi:ankyrin repeat protein
MVTAVLGVGLAALMLTCLFSASHVWWRSTMTPLQQAAYDGDANTCERLIKSGAAVDATDKYGVTALGFAVYQQRLAVVRKLIDLGANVNHADDEGRTPLIYVARAPFGKGGYAQSTMAARNEIAKLLLERGAEVNRAEKHHGDTALHWAVSDRNPELTQMLLAAGAEVNAKTSEGHTPMDIAKFPVYSPNDAVIAALQEHKR